MPRAIKEKLSPLLVRRTCCPFSARPRPGQWRSISIPPVVEVKAVALC